MAGEPSLSIAGAHAPVAGTSLWLRKGRSEGHWQRAWRRLRSRKLAMVCLAIIVGLFVVAIFAPVLAPYDYTAQDLRFARQPPSLAHPFGTDNYGRDQLSRVIWGARTAAIVATVPVAVAVVLGVCFGLVSGYFGGWVDFAIMRLVDFLLAFPGLLLAILLAATIRPRVNDLVRSLEAALSVDGVARSGLADYLLVLLVLAAIGWTGLARLLRAEVLKLRNEPYVLAARASGASGRWILLRHLLPNSMSIIVVVASASMGGAVMAESVLSYLGIGILDPTPSWGQMIYASAEHWRTAHSHLLYIPSLVVGAVILAFNLFGDALNDALNPKST